MHNEMNGFKKRAFLLKPLDVVFFRNNKSFDTSGVAYGAGHPYPQTLYGALFTKLLVNRDPHLLERWKKEFNGNLADTVNRLNLPSWFKQIYLRGPWLSKRNQQNVTVYLPIPTTLLQTASHNGSGESYTQLMPLSIKPSGWKESWQPLWNKSFQHLEPVHDLITVEGMKLFLNGNLDLKKEYFADRKDFLAEDSRTGIEIDPYSYTTKESKIYSISFQSLNSDTYYYAEIVVEESANLESYLPDRSILHWGGEKKMVSLEYINPIDWNVDPLQNGNTMFVLVTPGIFQEGWKPDGISNPVYSAKIPANEAVSGWNVAQNVPKPTRFAVPAGSVYFYQDSVHLSHHNSLCGTEELVQQGWGLAMKGYWKNA